jgi:hypothetical protein
MTYHLQLLIRRQRMAIKEVELPTDLERRDNVYNELNKIVDQLSALPVFPSLMWTWAFDVLRNIYEDNKEVAEYNDYVIAEGTELKQIFDKFWEDVDNLGISMDHGGEIIEEVIRDWMIDNDFLVSLDDDGWLDD